MNEKEVFIIQNPSDETLKQLCGECDVITCADGTKEIYAHENPFIGEKQIRQPECRMKVNILGTEYKIIIADEGEKPKLKNVDGYMDYSIKEIVVWKFDDGDPMNIADLESYTKKVLRHEIIHAFLYESGIWDNSGEAEAWGQSEEITDWIAIQFPKMQKAFEEAGAL